MINYHAVTQGNVSRTVVESDVHVKDAINLQWEVWDCAEHTVVESVVIIKDVVNQRWEAHRFVYRMVGGIGVDMKMGAANQQ